MGDFKEKEEIKDAKPVYAPKKNTFVERKLKAINQMSNKAKAKFLAEQVLRNK